MRVARGETAELLHGGVWHCSEIKTRGVGGIPLHSRVADFCPAAAAVTGKQPSWCPGPLGEGIQGDTPTQGFMDV